MDIHLPWQLSHLLWHHPRGRRFIRDSVNLRLLVFNQSAESNWRCKIKLRGQPLAVWFHPSIHKIRRLEVAKASLWRSQHYYQRQLLLLSCDWNIWCIYLQTMPACVCCGLLESDREEIPGSYLLGNKALRNQKAAAHWLSTRVYKSFSPSKSLNCRERIVLRASSHGLWNSLFNFFCSWIFNGWRVGHLHDKANTGEEKEPRDGWRRAADDNFLCIILLVRALTTN